MSITLSNYVYFSCVLADLVH